MSILAFPTEDASGDDPTRAMLRQEIQAAVRAELGPLVSELRAFVDRRFDEVSSELHSVLEFFDMSGKGIQQQLGAMRQEISAVVSQDINNSADNSGVELEAVVKITEEAANKIMEAAEAIAGRLESSAGGSEANGAIMDQLNSIFEACAFQDLTGQRVRRAIDRLATIESRLHLFAQHLDKEEVEVDRMAHAATSIRQDDIDRLLNG